MSYTHTSIPFIHRMVNEFGRAILSRQVLSDYFPTENPDGLTIIALALGGHRIPEKKTLKDLIEEFADEHDYNYSFDLITGNLTFTRK